MNKLIMHLNAAGLNVIVMDDDEPDMVMCPECGAEMWNDDSDLCEECEHEQWEANNPFEDNE